MNGELTDIIIILVIGLMVIGLITTMRKIKAGWKAWVITLIVSSFWIVAAGGTIKKIADSVEVKKIADSVEVKKIADSVEVKKIRNMDRILKSADNKMFISFTHFNSDYSVRCKGMIGDFSVLDVKTGDNLPADRETWTVYREGTEFVLGERIKRALE